MRADNEETEQEIHSLALMMACLDLSEILMANPQETIEEYRQMAKLYMEQAGSPGSDASWQRVTEFRRRELQLGRNLGLLSTKVVKKGKNFSETV
jgi:hypothetical protein